MNDVHDDAAASRAAALPERLAPVDLNLLVVFDALARERNVTRAAERLGVTQSAVSHALRRLREQLGDPLLVRGEGGMLLTARAEALVVPLRSGLLGIDRALHQAPVFDARASRRAFRLVSPDLFDLLAIPPLLERLRAAAPNVQLASVAPEAISVARALETGELDVAIAPRVDGFDADAELDAPGLVRRVSFRDGFACFCRADHPALTTAAKRAGGRRAEPALSPESYASSSHALVSPAGEGPSFVDELLARQGLRRRVVLRVRSFVSALAIVERSDLMLTAPASLVRLLAPGSAVRCVRAPLPLPEHALQLIWHERFSNDPGHAFFRELLLEVGRQLGAMARGSLGDAAPRATGAPRTTRATARRSSERRPRARSSRGA